MVLSDYRRRGYVSTTERKQQEEAQSIERKRLKGKNYEHSEKDQILNRDGKLYSENDSIPSGGI